ncbi:MAG: hypothetical protein ABWJ97_03685 [Thermoproteus sp.]
MNKITWFFRRVQVAAMLFVLWLLYLYFKLKAGPLDQMRAMAFLALIMPLLFYISIEDAVRKAKSL